MSSVVDRIVAAATSEMAEGISIGSPPLDEDVIRVAVAQSRRIVIEGEIEMDGKVIPVTLRGQLSSPPLTDEEAAEFGMGVLASIEWWEQARRTPR